MMTTTGMLAARQLARALAGARQLQLHGGSQISAEILAPLSASGLRLLHSSTPSFHAALPQQAAESSSAESTTSTPSSTSSSNPRSGPNSRNKTGQSPAAASAAAEQLLKSFDAGFTQAKAAYQAAATAATDAAAAAAASSRRAAASASAAAQAAASSPLSSAAGTTGTTAGSSGGSDAASSSGASGSSSSTASTSAGDGAAGAGGAAGTGTEEAGTSGRTFEEGASGSASGAGSSSDQQQQQEEGDASGSGRSRVQAGRDMFTFVAKEVRETLSSASDIRSATRKYDGPLASEAAPYTGTSALVASNVKVKATGWQRMFDTIREKMPFISKMPTVDVAGSAPFRKGKEFAEDLKDRWDTSDHPVVHKVEDMKARVFTGSEASRAMAEVRARDANFDMNRFVQSVKLDAPGVTRAFLRHDLETLKLHCGTELLERFSGIFKHFADQGLFEDPTILFVGDVEIVEVRWVDEDPFIIAQFHCQQLKCTRDKFGNVVDGSGETIQRVYYFWGLQMEKDPIVTAEGEVLPPRWVIKDMMWQSMLALV